MKFFDIINQWANRYFSQPDAIYLVAVLVIAMALLMAFGGALAPVLTGLVIAFLLQGIVGSLEHRRVPRWAAVYLAFLLFLGTDMHAEANVEADFPHRVYAKGGGLLLIAL